MADWIKREDFNAAVSQDLATPGPGSSTTNYLVQSYQAGQYKPGELSSAVKSSTTENNSGKTNKKSKNYLADSGKKLSEDKDRKQTIVEKAKSALSSAVDAVTGGNRSQRRLEKLQEKYGSATYDDDFWGQTKANFGAGRISEAEAQAWSDYMDDPTEENRQRAVSYSQLNQDFRTRNAEALDDENVKAGLISKNLAGYLPQMGNQIKASLAPTVALTAGGALLGEATTPIPIADAAAGAALGYKAGRTVGTGFYSYQNMRGYAFKNLIEAGASESAAKDAAEDEAIVSSVIEMGDEAIEQFAKIPGISKSFKKVGGDAVSAIAGSGLKKAAKEYLKNIGQEYSEEFIQEVVSIANERRVENGTTGSGIRGLLNECKNVIADMASGAVNGQVTDDLAQAHEAGVGGGVIGAVMFPVNAAVGGAINTAQRNISQGIENRIDPNGASTRTALRNEINSISKMSQTAQEQAITAWNSHRDQLGYAKTGDVLVGMMTRPDGSVEVNHVYGRVTGHVRDGFIMTLSDENNRPVVVPDGFLTNQTVISVLNNNGEFISQSELNERSDVSDITPEDIANAPFGPEEGQQQTPAQPIQPVGQSFQENPSVTQASDEFNQWFSQQPNTEAANGYKFTVDGVEYEVREVSRTNDGKPIYAVFHGSQKVSAHFQNPGDAIGRMAPLPAERAAEIDAADTANQSLTSTNNISTSNDNTASNTSTTSVDISNNTGNTNTSSNTGTEETAASLTTSTSPSDSDYRSTASIVEEIDDLPNRSIEELQVLYESLGERGHNMSVKQTEMFKDAIQKELASRGESAIITENTEGDAANGSVQTNESGSAGSVDVGERSNSEQEGPGSLRGRRVVGGTEGTGAVQQEQAGDVTPQPGQRKVSGRDATVVNSADGNYYEVDLGDGNVLRVEEKDVNGENGFVFDDELDDNLRRNADRFKSFGFDSVVFTRNKLWSDNSQSYSSFGRVVHLRGGKQVLIFDIKTPKSIVSLTTLTKHEMTHMYSMATTKASKNARSAYLLAEDMKTVVGEDNYNKARNTLLQVYYPSVYPDSMDASDNASFEAILSKYPEKSARKQLLRVHEEMLANLMSNDTCYGAWQKGMQKEALKNDAIINHIRDGIDSFNLSDEAKRDLQAYYGIPLVAESATRETAQESSQTAPIEEGKTAPPQQPEASTPQSDELNQPSTPTESSETAQEEKVDPKKLAKQEFREHYDDAVEKTNRLGRLRTIAERAAPKDAPKHEQHRAENFKKGMTTLKENLRKLTSGEMKGDDFAQYYLGLNRSSDGMASYYDSKTAARWQSVRDAWAEVKQSADPDNVTRYSGELGRAVDQMVRSIERIDRAQRTLESMSETASKNRFDTKSKNIFKKIARTYLRWQINPTNVFRAIDGFDRNARGDGYRFQQRIDNSVADYQRLNVESQAALSKVKQMKNFQKFAAGQSMTNVHIGNTQLNTLQALGFIKTVDTLRATSPEKPFTISGFALDLGNGEYEFVEARDININKVYKQCTAAVDDVARAYKLAADEVFDLLGKRVMSTAESINGYSPYAFEKGKYYPLWYKTNSTDGHNWSITHSIDGNLQEKRFTHERSEDNPGYLVVSPITKVVDDYITQATNYSAFGELGSDLELMNREENINGSISQMMAKNFGTEMAGWMKNYIDDVNEVIETDTEGINELFRAGRNMLAQGALLFSPSVQMKQVASYWNAAGVIRMDALTAAYRFKELRAKGGANGNALYDYRKLGNVDPTISDALKAGWVEKLSSKSKLFNNIANMTNIKDLRTVDNVYTACVLDTAMSYPSMDKNSATFQNLVEQKFQEAVLNTQPIFTKQARAEYSRTDNEIVRMLSMFRTQQTQNFNRLITTLGEYNADRRNKVATSESAEALTQTIKGQIGSAFSFAALSVAADLLLHRTKKYRDDDGELDVGAFLERLGLNAVEAGAATFWQVDNLAKWAIDKISGGETNEFYGISMGPVSTIVDVVESVEYLLQTPSLSNLRYTAGYIGTLTGMPINNVYAMINSVAMYARDLSGENKEHFDDLLKWTENENRPENQLIKSFTSGDTDRANELYDALVAKETKSKTAESVVKSEVKAKIDLEELDHDDAVNLLLEYGGYDDKKDAEKEVKIYELLHSDDINYNTLGESYREGEISKDDVIAARINIAGDTEEEAEQYVSKQDFQSQFGFSYTDMKDKYRAGKITASQAITWRMRCSGVTRESAAEWVQAQDVFLATGYEYVNTGSASYYDSYATKETIGSNTFYERHISEFPNKKAFGAVFNDLDTNSKEKTFPTLTNRYGELGSKQTRVIFTLRDHIAKGNISPALAKEIWEEYYGYSTYNWHFVTD